MSLKKPTHEELNKSIELIKELHEENYPEHAKEFCLAVGAMEYQKMNMGA